jgi:class 3 adenylate cyclase
VALNEREVRCPRCQHDNPAGMKFCGQCATPLAAVCPACHAANPPENRFCGQCAVPLSLMSTPRFAGPDAYTPKRLAEKILTSRGALEGERKQVTVLFADVKGSMELLADRDPEEARTLLDPVLDRMMEAVHRYEGTVNQVMGDGIMALFGAPLAHEDHAVRACYAALDLQRAMRRLTEALRQSHGATVEVRVGLNSGEVVVRAISSDLHLDYTAVGQTTHLAARMEQLASPGTTLLTADTLRLAEGYVEVKPLGAMPVKGLPAPVETYEQIGAGPRRSRLSAAAARGLTRFVGRDAEIEQLREALGRAASGHGQVVAIIGEPGVGKSRLVWEVTHSHRTHGWLILEAGAVSYGKATPYRPVIDLLKGYLEVGDRDEPRAIREKVTGKLLALDRALEPALPAFLALLDVPVEDRRWEVLDPPQRRQRTIDALSGLELARRALTIAIGLGDVSLQASANYQLAAIGNSTGDYRQSAEALGRELLQGDRRHERLAGIVGSVAWRGRLVWCLAELGEFADATAPAEEAVRIASEVDHLLDLAFAHRSLGFAFLRRGAIPQAIPPLERAVELCRVGVRVLFDITAAHLGYAYALSGRLPEGVALMEEALADPESTGTVLHPLLLAYLGGAHLLAGRRDDALAVARRALDLAHRQKEHGSEAWVLRLLGEIAIRHDPPDAEAAGRHYREALARAEELGMRPLVAHCHLGLGQLLSRAGDRVKAREHLTTAATMYREMEMESWLARAEAEGAML